MSGVVRARIAHALRERAKALRREVRRIEDKLAALKREDARDAKSSEHPPVSPAKHST